jgi:hypothetical protein
MEAKRVDHLVAEFLNLQRIDQMRTDDYVYRYRLVGRLLPIYDSSAFALAERLSRLRRPGRPNVTRADLGALLDEVADGDLDVDHLRHFPEPSPEGDGGLRVDRANGDGPNPSRTPPARPDLASGTS